MLRQREQERSDHMSPTGTSIIGEVDRLIEEYSLLKHPFYQAWQRG